MTTNNDSLQDHRVPGVTTSSHRHYVVGIGASAGGLEALEQFFDHMHPSSGMSFVVIQHLSPHYKSFMAELLAGHTSMEILVAEDQMKIHENCIYLIPPNKTMTLNDGKLQLADLVPNSGLNMPIDMFFHSLAKDCGSQAIGVILSGTGSDGSKGIAAIKDAGGLVLVQDDTTAKFDGMPVSARLTGFVDAVMPPEEMAQKLLEISQSSSMSQHIPVDFTSTNQTDLYIKQIFDMIKQSSGIDFNYYKRNSVFRRIERRMVLSNMHNLPEYTEFLRQNHSEQTALRKDLLIGVTQFFRDEEAFAIIRDKVLPAIFEEKKQDLEIRVWIAGCSTGEEAYSLAILLKEYMMQMDELYSIKIFATDLDKDSIEYASTGIYPESAVKNMPADLRSRYFTKDDDTYRINKELRKMIVFAPHNITKDPPFSNLDLITCRNMLIYLTPEMQRKVLSMFHFVLNSKGVLFLGPSESIGRLTNQFDSIDRRWNIFQHKRMKDVVYTGNMEVASSEPRTVRSNYRQNPKPYPHLLDEPSIKRPDDVYSTFVDEHMPPSIVIDENNDIIHLSGDINPFLSLSKGRPSWNLYKMVEPHLSVAIATAFQKVRREKRPIIYKSLRLREKEDGEFINLTVKPFSMKNKEFEKLALVTFERAQKREDTVIVAEEHFDVSSNVNQRVIELEMELQRAEETLQATVEELETSNEELQATNEELVAANEELQSTNEELQSVNEELVTVNTEYQYKIQELTELNNDMNNFLVSTKIGTIFLDKNMCIRRFTPAITKEINLLDVDYGRPISHISHNFKYENLVKESKKVLKTLTPVEKEVQSNSGKWYSMRILPYRTADNFISGIVLTFVEITELKLANTELVKLSYAVEQSPSISIIADLEGRIEYVNPYFTSLTGFVLEDVMGRNLRFLNTWESEGHPQYREIWDTVTSGHTWTGELESRKKNGEVFWEAVRIVPIKNKKGKTVHYLKVAEDITDKRTTEELLRKSEMLSAVGQLAAGIAHEIRNPLTALKGFTKLLTSGKHNDSYIRVMSDELNRIEEIVSELLVLAKPQLLEYSPKFIEDIMKDVIMLLDTQAIMNSVEIQFEGSGCLVNCVENQIKQVFINILKNAIEAMPSGGIINVNIRKEQDERVTVTVVDSGTGIPEDKLPKLGEPFYSTKEKGTGLGLMVSYKIIENHMGTIAYASKQGVGTTVTIVLPLHAQA
ncbi:CheR family methyltransferase [Paenibacillus hexagrammi]|uniref:PAS domain-containing protein n=1 Tax=Paenibacillus hexagrammi TaxID=2908839 RepID=A0ABY3SKR8_9BACL|nr:CheR family methyltransferase [Paenibacillus sp. YPD9-1]UJF34115.1 PAS domain-containing protein [Paenibacillus sp. YPD9-1]